MRLQRISVLVFVLFVITYIAPSCNRAPFACFSTSVDVDSIYRYQPVTFVASCSNNADEYFWQFYDKDDSTEFGYAVTRTFYDTGAVNVYLLVTSGRKTSSTLQTIYVKP